MKVYMNIVISAMQVLEKNVTSLLHLWGYSNYLQIKSLRHEGHFSPALKLICHTQATLESHPSVQH